MKRGKRPSFEIVRNDWHSNTSSDISTTRHETPQKENRLSFSAPSYLGKKNIPRIGTYSQKEANWDVWDYEQTKISRKLTFRCPTAVESSPTDLKTSPHKPSFQSLSTRKGKPSKSHHNKGYLFERLELILRHVKAESQLCQSHEDNPEMNVIFQTLKKEVKLSEEIFILEQILYSFQSHVVTVCSIHGKLEEDSFSKIFIILPTTELHPSVKTFRLLHPYFEKQNVQMNFENTICSRLIIGSFLTSATSQT